MNIDTDLPEFNELVLEDTKCIVRISVVFADTSKRKRIFSIRRVISVTRCVDQPPGM